LIFLPLSYFPFVFAQPRTLTGRFFLPATFYKGPLLSMPFTSPRITFASLGLGFSFFTLAVARRMDGYPPPDLSGFRASRASNQGRRLAPFPSQGGLQICEGLERRLTTKPSWLVRSGVIFEFPFLAAGSFVFFKSRTRLGSFFPGLRRPVDRAVIPLRQSSLRIDF